MLDTFIHQSIEKYSGYKAGKWCYEDGCFFKGVADLYEATKDEWYFNQLLNLINQQIKPDGKIDGYELSEYNLCNLNGGKVLFLLYEKTNDVRFLIALRKLRDQLRTHPRTTAENFWHKSIYPYQVYLGGLYMGLPLLAQYSLMYESGQSLADIRKQFFNVRSTMFDSKKGLYYHGYDESRQSNWADMESGLSATFWSRAMGWYVMALVDVCDIIGNQHSDYVFYARLLKEIAENILLWQQPQGLWMQVMDQPETQGNYLETSASVMIAYAFLKGQRLQILTDHHAQAGRKVFIAIQENHLELNHNTWELKDISGMAGLGAGDASFDTYIFEPIVSNDPKGVGPMFMLIAEILRQENQNGILENKVFDRRSNICEPMLL